MTSDTQLSLNEVHTDLVRDYLQFSRYQQNQRMKSVQHCFHNLLNFKIREDETYNADEVIKFVEDLKDIVDDEVKTELTDSVHTNVLFIQQLLKQAEEWHLTLTYNVSELENRDKLNIIRNYDESCKIDPEKRAISVSKSRVTIPIEDYGAATALKAEVVQLLAENDILKKRLSELEAKEEANDKQNSGENSTADATLAEELEKAKEEIQALKDVIEANARKSNETVIDFESLEKVKTELEAHQGIAEQEMEKLRADLSSREAKLRQVQSNLLLAEKELEKKFQATGAYANMKKILVQKNATIKSLRRKLALFNISQEDLGQDEEVEAEEDEKVEDD